MDASPHGKRKPTGEDDGPDRTENQTVHGQVATAQDTDEESNRQSGQAIERDQTPATSPFFAHKAALSQKTQKTTQAMPIPSLSACMSVNQCGLWRRTPPTKSCHEPRDESGAWTRLCT